MKITQIIFYSVLTSHLLAAGEPTVSGARSLAMGGLCMPGVNAHAALNHPAALALMETSAISVDAYKPYTQQHWHYFTANLILHARQIGIFSVSGVFKGTAFFHESLCAIGYARRLSKNVQLGVRMDYWQLYMKEYGIRRFYNPHVSLSYQPRKFLSLGFSVHHPIPYSIIKGKKDKTSPVLKLGMCYTPSEKWLAGAEYEQGIWEKPRIKLGIEYIPLHFLSVQAGYRSNGHGVCIGAGLRWKKTKLHTACMWQPGSGFTPAISLQFDFSLVHHSLHETPNHPDAVSYPENNMRTK